MYKYSHNQLLNYSMFESKPELLEVFSKFKHVMTIENGCLMGGFGSAVLEFAADNGYHSTIKDLVFLIVTSSMERKKSSIVNVVLILMILLKKRLKYYKEIFLLA